MDSSITFTLSDVGWFLIWGLVVVLLAYLILILHRAYKTIKNIQLIVTDNKEYIDQTLEEVPGLVKNVEDITEEVAHGAQAFRGTVDNVAETSEEVTGAINENGTVISSLASIMETMAVGKAMYEKFFGNDKNDNSDEDK